MMDHLIKGILIGLIFGVPVGAVGALCVSRSLASGVMLVFGIVTGILFCGGVMNIGEIESSGKLQEAYEMGKQI